MNIFEYDLNSLDIEEVARLFEIFKENSEKEGHTAIAIPKDQTIYQDVDNKTLYNIQKIVHEELKRRALKEDEEYRKSKQEYLGKCFESENQLIKIIDFDFKNKYRFICLVLYGEADYRNENIILEFDSLGLLCNDPYNFGDKIIDRYKEISEEEFQRIFKNKIEENCFGIFKCQG